jgi:hypothetical protein
MADPVREQRFLGRILPGMDVCDVGGDKIGSIAQIHRFSELPDPADESVPDEVMEVKTGLLGLGKHLYVPLSAVQEVLPESVFLSRPKEDFESLGYYTKPTHLS